MTAINENATQNTPSEDVSDRLFNLETEFLRIRLFAESIERVMDEYVEDCGLDVHPTVEHAQICLWHLVDDCRKFEEGYTVTAMEVRKLVVRPAE